MYFTHAKKKFNRLQLNLSKLICLQITENVVQMYRQMHPWPIYKDYPRTIYLQKKPFDFSKFSKLLTVYIPLLAALEMSGNRLNRVSW